MTSAVPETMRSHRSGALYQAFFHAKDPHRAVITSGCTAPYCKDGNANSSRFVLAEYAPAFVAENIRIELKHKQLTVSDG